MPACSCGLKSFKYKSESIAGNIMELLLARWTYTQNTRRRLQMRGITPACPPAHSQQKHNLASAAFSQFTAPPRISLSLTHSARVCPPSELIDAHNIAAAALSCQVSLICAITKFSKMTKVLNANWVSSLMMVFRVRTLCQFTLFIIVYCALRHNHLHFDP